MIRSSLAFSALAALLFGCGSSGKLDDTTAPSESDADADADSDADSDADADVDTTVFLNEIQGADTSGSEDWIELVNTGSAAADIGGWQIGDGIDAGKTPWSFPAGTSVPAGGYLLLYAKGSDTAAEGADFKIDKDGDQVWLLNPDGAIADTTTLAGLAPDQSWARIPDGTGDWAISNSPTPEAANKP